MNYVEKNEKFLFNQWLSWCKDMKQGKSVDKEALTQKLNQLLDDETKLEKELINSDLNQQLYLAYITGFKKCCRLMQVKQRYDEEKRRNENR